MVSSKVIEAPPLEAPLRTRALVQRLTGGRRLVVASNRGPLEYAFGDDGMVNQKQGCGGVALTLSNLVRYAPVTWVAAAMTDADRVAARRNASDGRQSPSLRLRLAETHRGAYDAHYNLICNPILWFLQHGQWERLSKHRTMAEIEKAWLKGYVPVNRAFAHLVLEELAAADTAPIVMFHDYHLYVAPLYVRAQAPKAVLSHFVHIPWPRPDAWQQLPWQMTTSILEGLLACDLVGFQTLQSADNFLLTSFDFIRGAAVDFENRCVTLNGRRTLVRAYPISVDVAALRARIESPSVEVHKMKLALDRAPYTIVRVDRLDPAKNIVTGFQAFELLLAQHPELAGRVRFLAFLVPSRQSIPEYRSYKEEVFDIVQKINCQWGTPEWLPIELFYEHNYEQALAGLALYDVLLVNSLADGMNLVCKEGAVVNENYGVIVLSQAAGSFLELGHAAVPLNPGDVGGTAEALATSLFMSQEERRERSIALRQAVENNDFPHWLGRQFADLERLAADRQHSRRNGRERGGGNEQR